MVKLKDLIILAVVGGVVYLLSKVKDNGKEGDITITVVPRPEAGISPLTVNFEARISNAVMPLRRTNWDFGDGDSSQLPSHTYTTDLQFEVSFNRLVRLTKPLR